VVVELQNDLSVPTTIHWHGIDVPYAMDGVVAGTHGHGGADTGLPPEELPGLVAPGARFRYEFVVDRAMTAWYHPHFDSANQVDLGLYGAFVVEDPAEPRLDVDRVLVLDDVNPEALAEAGSHAAAHSAHGEGLWLVNGAPAPSLPVIAGQRLRLRFINASNVGTVVLAREDGEPLRVIARDQGALPAAEPVASELMAPGDRVELELLPGPEGLRLIDLPWVHEGGAATGEPAVLLELVASGAGPAAAPQFVGAALPPTADPGRTDVRWLLQGSLTGDDWRINGEVFPEVTPALGWVGVPLVIEVQNLSPTEHPFHLHGMAFEVLSIDGAPPAQRRVEDTLNLALYQRARLMSTPPSAGDWMAHCHILPHADGGMMTLLHVEEAP
jgi:FtsP/CotA-like multicopper oxidase with cupredoxin domain